MKAPGYVLALIGIVVIALAAVNHFVKALPVVASMGHGSIITGVVGVVLLVVGIFVARPSNNK